MSTASTSDVSSLASRLRRTASNLSDSVLSHNSDYTSTRLAFDDDHANRVASSAQSFADSVNTSPSSLVRRFLDSLSYQNSNDSLLLASEHRDLLRAGAAGEVMSELTRDGQFGRLDTLHGCINSVLDRHSTDSQDGRLIRALPGQGPPSYHSLVSESPPPTYVSPLRTISSGSSVPLSTQSRDTSPHELDRATGDMNCSPRSTSNRSSSPRAAELDSTPISVYELDNSTPSSVARQWANSVTAQTSLARSVRANSSSASHPASRYFSSVARVPSPTASLNTGQSKRSRSTWNRWRSLARRLSRSARSSRSSAVEPDGRPITRNKSHVSFAPYPSPGSSSSFRGYNRSYTTSTQSWAPAPLRIGRHPSLTSSKGGSSQLNRYLPASLRIASMTSNNNVPRTVSTLARSINSLASQTPSSVLLRRQAEFARSQMRTRQAVSSALASDALSQLPSSLLGYLSTASRVSRTTNQHFGEGSAFQAMSNSLVSGSVPQLYRTAEILRGQGHGHGGRVVDVDEIDYLISGLQEYRDRLQGYQESSLARSPEA